ncbi:MAG: nucleotidyl transferase AbiEii/AbiGii toxin family protein [Candidatus Margulisiibacteriota bacterium]
MFEQVLPGNTKEILALLEGSEIVKNAYLAGGTALALQMGHRISYDLDFFTQEEFNEEKLLSEIRKISDFKPEKISWRTILGTFKDVKFSIFYYEYPLLFPPGIFGQIKVVDISDIAAMKLAAAASRGTKRDFVDLYFICKDHLALDECIKLYGRKYKNLDDVKVHLMKSLIFFNDADPEEMPHMLKECKWEKVKQFFISEVKKIMNK